MKLEELLNELLDLANEHGGSADTNIQNVVCSPKKTNNSKEVTVIVKIKK